MVSLQDVPFVCFNAYMANMKNCGPRYGVDAVGADMIVMYELSCMKFKACRYFIEMQHQTGQDFPAALFVGATITRMMTRVNKLDQFVAGSDDSAPPPTLKSMKDWYERKESEINGTLQNTRNASMETPLSYLVRG